MVCCEVRSYSFVVVVSYSSAHIVAMRYEPSTYFFVTSCFISRRRHDDHTKRYHSFFRSFSSIFASKYFQVYVRVGTRFYQLMCVSGHVDTIEFPLLTSSTAARTFILYRASEVLPARFIDRFGVRKGQCVKWRTLQVMQWLIKHRPRLVGASMTP